MNPVMSIVSILAQYQHLFSHQKGNKTKGKEQNLKETDFCLRGGHR